MAFNVCLSIYYCFPFSMNTISNFDLPSLRRKIQRRNLFYTCTLNFSVFCIVYDCEEVITVDGGNLYF